MVTIKSFTQFIPLAIFAGTSYFSNRADRSDAINFKAATEAYTNLAKDLKAYPLNTADAKAYWSANMTSLTNVDNGVIDTKLSIDAINVATVSSALYGLGILSPIFAIVPVIPYAIFTSMIATSESARNQAFHSIIKDLWSPSCDVQNLKFKLMTADKIGSSYDSEKYAEFISTFYSLEDTSKIVEGLTVVTGLLISKGALSKAAMSCRPVVDPDNPTVDPIEMGSTAINLLSTISYAASSAIIGAIFCYNPVSNNEIYSFIHAREEAKHELAEGFLKAQIGECPVEEIMQHTIGCGNNSNEIIENLLSGVDGCTYNDPFASYSL